MSHTPSSNSFDIRQWIDFDGSGRAACPSCIQDGKSFQKNLSVNFMTGAYHCWRGCTPRQIRAALGHSQPSKPFSITSSPSRSLAVRRPRIFSAKQVLLSQHRLLNYHDRPQKLARQWLFQRGFTREMVQYYHIGLERWQHNKEHHWAIALHIPANQEDCFYRKLRISPWHSKPNLPKWSQPGVPATIFHTYFPDDAEATWFCEGEWDAMQLGWLARQQQARIAVCCSTAGCATIPLQAQLNELPGVVIIFFDRNDPPTKSGSVPGDAGARKLARALDGRGRIAQVPMTPDCAIAGWDVSDAIQAGFTWADFEQAASLANPTESKAQTESRVLRQILEEALCQTDSSFQTEIDTVEESGINYRNINLPLNTHISKEATKFDHAQSVLNLEELLHSHPVPFDVYRFLEPWFAEILTKTAQAIPIVPEFLFTTLLPVAASRIGTAAQIVIKSSAKYTQPMVFWSAIVAPSSSLETSAQRVILDPLISLEEEAHRHYEAELEEYDRLQSTGERPKKPIRKRYLIKNATIGTLRRIHADNPRGILCYSIDQGAELEQWAGSAMIFDLDKKAVCLPHSAISRTRTIQKRVLAEWIGNPQNTNDTWSYWLFYAAEPLPQYLSLSDDELDTGIAEALIWLYQQLEQLPQQDYFISPKAKWLFEAWQHRLVDARQAELNPRLKSIYPKIEAYTARLALWLHIVNAVLQQRSPSQLIDEKTLDQAIQLSAYYLWQHRFILSHCSTTSPFVASIHKLQRFKERLGEVTALRLRSGLRTLRKISSYRVRSRLNSKHDLSVML